jgi:hypothetical protein
MVDRQGPGGLNPTVVLSENSIPYDQKIETTEKTGDLSIPGVAALGVGSENSIHLIRDRRRIRT